MQWCFLREFPIGHQEETNSQVHLLFRTFPNYIPTTFPKTTAAPPWYKQTASCVQARGVMVISPNLKTHIAYAHPQCLPCTSPPFQISPHRQYPVDVTGKKRRKWQSTPVFLPGESHGRRSLVGYSPQGCKESDTTERLHLLEFYDT